MAEPVTSKSQLTVGDLVRAKDGLMDGTSVPRNHVLMLVGLADSTDWAPHENSYVKIVYLTHHSDVIHSLGRRTLDAFEKQTDRAGKMESSIWARVLELEKL